MKFYIIAIAILLAVLGALALVTSSGSPSSVPMSSSPDDSSMKTLNIN